MAVAAEQSILKPAIPRAPGWDEHEATHPYRAGLFVMLAGYVLLTGVLVGLGILLTHVLDGSVGRWDEHVNEYLARHRSTPWNDVTAVATAGFNTLPVVLGAAVVVGLLALRRRFSEAAFLTLALLLEITVFLSVNFVVARPRPAVHRLNSTPSTSSFPSGHTAAATVLVVGIALIVMCCTSNRLARTGSTFVAAVISVTVGFARVYRGLHHPTDVFAGLLYGLACLAIAALAVRAANRRMHRENPRRERQVARGSHEDDPVIRRIA